VWVLAVIVKLRRVVLVLVGVRVGLVNWRSEG
jgi:hypothetical protein